MSATVQRPCSHAGCSAFAAPGARHCVRHLPAAVAEKTAQRARLDDLRGSAASRGYDARWARAARDFRTRFPFSFGYLTRTALWTHNLAAIFAEARAHAAAQRALAGFFQPGGGLDHFLGEFPIYTFHRSARPEPAQVVDHIIPHAGRAELFWPEWNWQALSKRQHDTKTASEDGGFGLAKKSS